MKREIFFQSNISLRENHDSHTLVSSSSTARFWVYLIINCLKSRFDGAKFQYYFPTAQLWDGMRAFNRKRLSSLCFPFRQIPSTKQTKNISQRKTKWLRLSSQWNINFAVALLIFSSRPCISSSQYEAVENMSKLSLIYQFPIIWLS